MTLSTKGAWFIDKVGRSILLRGVNLGGSTKVPVSPNGSTHIKTDFSDHQDVSFIGRPFPPDETQEHLERIKHWGFNCLRFLTTWEAVEHKGPGEYDAAYLDYFRSMVQIASDLGFFVFIDPHQDVWSRMSGGDGAPGWLFEKIGLDFTKFDATDAAIVMQHRFPKDYPPMCWTSNFSRFASATMFTLFFGGNDFASECKVDGTPVQDYMQSHYFNAIKQVTKYCKNIENVIGYDILNEPRKGFIAHKDIRQIEGTQPPGLHFAPFEAIITASGIPRKVPIYEIKRFNLRKTGEKLVNPEGVSCWLPGREDIWREHGVWDLNQQMKPYPCKPDYFSKSLDGKEINFVQDFLYPFIDRFAEEIRSVVPDTLIFIEGEPFSSEWEDGISYAPNIVNANHWYDTITLMTKKFRSYFSVDVIGQIKLVFGSRGVKKMFKRQLNAIMELSRKGDNRIPTLIGEFGLPFDLEKKKAYRTGDFSAHIKALTWYYEAMDTHLLHSALWNYTADNCNEWGDLWNQEDLSIFSRDQQSDPNDINSGGRAIMGFSRPYARKTSGTPIEMEFNYKKKEFLYIFDADSSIKASTEVFIPDIHYPNGCSIEILGGEYSSQKSDQVLKIKPKESTKYTIKITRP